MKKLFSVVVLLMSVGLCAHANTFTPAPKFPLTFGDSPTPADCVLKSQNFCQCWATTIINGCIADGMGKWCTIGNIIAEVKVEGIPAACSNALDCELQFYSFIYNHPANNPVCPQS